MATRVIERRGADALDELAALWHALKNHHGECTPGIPVRDDAESWALRRADYEGWLAQPGAFLLLAYENDAPVAYALVRIQEAGPTWLEPARGGGVGRALLDRVQSESGCEVVELVVLSANTSAKTFYERLGFESFAETLRRRA
jgi:RimJ/RimL family protein N-acetyltransferase